MSNSDNWRIRAGPVSTSVLSNPSKRTRSNPSTRSRSKYKTITLLPKSDARTQSQQEGPGYRRKLEHRGQSDVATHDPTEAFAEGRRIFVGHIPCMAKLSDVASLFETYNVCHIDIPINPLTGRNRSYCFVELTTKGEADRAMKTLDGRVFLGRPLKVQPEVPKGGRKGGRIQYIEERSGESSPAATDNTYTPDSPMALSKARTSIPLAFEGWVRKDAEEHWKGIADQGQ